MAHEKGDQQPLIAAKSLDGRTNMPINIGPTAGARRDHGEFLLTQIVSKEATFRIEIRKWWGSGSELHAHDESGEGVLVGKRACGRWGQWDLRHGMACACMGERRGNASRDGYGCGHPPSCIIRA